jgi:hypothetical protein
MTNFQDTARELVQAWVAKNVAHGGAVDVLEVANGSFDGEDYCGEALNSPGAEEKGAKLLEFVDSSDEALWAVRKEFAAFVEDCVAQADAMED